MTDPNLTEIVVVLDRSGSMNERRDEAVQSYNAFLEAQRKVPGKALFSLTLFNTEFTIEHNGIPLESVPDMTVMRYNPQGFTALLDAVGKTIDEVGTRLAATPESKRPHKVIFAILTDGQENSSHEYPLSIVKAKTEEQQKVYGWEFIYLGMGPETFEDAGKLGVPQANTMTWDTSVKGGVGRGMGSVSSTIASCRVS